MNQRVLSLALLVACRPPDEARSPSEEADTAVIEEIGGPDASARPPDEPSREDTGWRDAYEALFDPEVVQEIRLTIAPAGLAALAADPRTYVQASFEHAGNVRDDVGVRLKGNNSYRDLDEKPALRVRFGAFDAEAERYAGLERLVLNNLVNDPAQGREVVAYWAWNQAGLPVPRAAFAHLTVNDEDYGLYAILEGMDEAWVEKRWADASGDLWEANDSADLTPTGVLHYELAAGEGDFARLVTAARALSAPTDDFLARADPWVDTDAFLSFWAWTMAVGNLDGYPYNLDDHFLYANPGDDGRLVFSPWGLDETWDTGWRWQWGRGRVSFGCAADTACLEEVYAHVRDALDDYEAMDVAGQAERLFLRTDATALVDPRSPYTPAEVQAARLRLVTRMQQWPDEVRASIWPPAPAEDVAEADTGL